MPKPRRLSGRELIRILGQFGFVAISQRGSHVKVRRVSGSANQTLTVPAHDELDIGTLRAVLRQASRFVPEEELRRAFYESDARS